MRVQPLLARVLKPSQMAQMGYPITVSLNPGLKQPNQIKTSMSCKWTWLEASLYIYPYDRQASSRNPIKKRIQRPAILDNVLEWIGIIIYNLSDHKLIIVTFFVFQTILQLYHRISIISKAYCSINSNTFMNFLW